MATTPSPQFEFWTFRRVMWGTLVLTAVVASFWLLYRFYQAVFILIIAILIGTTLDPVVDWLNRKGLPRWLGCLLVYLILLVLIISFLLLLLPLLVEQGVTIYGEMPGYYQNFREWMIGQPNILLSRLGGILPLTLFGSAVLTPPTGEEMLNTAGQAFGYVARVTSILLQLGVVLLLAFYWTLDGPRITRSWLLLIPADRRESTRSLIAGIETKVGAYVAGQGVLCLVIGVLALIAYLIIGLPYVLVLALIAGILEAVPIVGPILGAVPASLVALSIAPDKLIWVIAATVIIQQLENNLLVPRVMRRAVGVNPFVSLLSLFAFSSLLGIPGALMAVPAAAIIQLLLDQFVFRAEALGAELSTDRGFASQLRYEAQDLIQDLRKQARLQTDYANGGSKAVNEAMDELETLTKDLDVQLADTVGTEAGAAGKP